MPLASLLQEQIHGSKEKYCHLLHQDAGPIAPSCYTHSAEDLQELEKESRHFIKMMKENVAEYDPCDMINMD
jgi:hypothetical protein